MEELKKLFSDISDEDLKDAIREIKNLDEIEHITEDSIIRKYSNLSSEITGEPSTTSYFSTIVNLVKEGAYRWIA